MTAVQGASASIEQPTYWWYRARSELFRQLFDPYVPREGRLLDVGSADGPSTAWAQGLARRTALDVDPRGLRPGDVCASADALPFRDGSFDAVCAFDVVEHCASEPDALAELGRVLRPGCPLLVSVPAYQWAWTDFDDRACHHRRYTKGRLVRALQANGFEVVRATYLFAHTFPAFAFERLSRKRRAKAEPELDLLPTVPPAVEKALLGLCRADAAVLRVTDLPFGSSVVAVARKAA